MRDTAQVTDQAEVVRIVRPVPAAVRSVWPGEATHFTPWLAENLDWLEDSLQLGPLELVGTEVLLPTVARSLDILARTQDGNRIAIENQYAKVDHDHLTRGLAYAVGHEAQALVVIAEDHGSEFVAIADYLNRAYEKLGPEHGIAVYLLRLTVERVGEAYVPRFTAVSRPNVWLAAVQAQENAPASVRAFVESCSERRRSLVDRIVTEWSARTDASIRVNPKSSSVSLDFPYSGGQAARSIYVLYNSGVLTVNRGYFVEAGAPEDLLDAAIREHFPTINAKPYYPSVSDPDPSSVAVFADWLIDRMGLPPT